jgi:ergothioneine biosynthesis protein EgtB
MPDASPTKWHLGHTSWFFETFVLRERQPGYRTFDDSFEVLFNSYYNTVGAQHPRPRRGLLTRPSLERVLAYRAHVDDAMTALLAAGRLDERDVWVVDVGLHHEQQHQELILMDLQHLLSCNPTDPVYVESPVGETRAPGEMRYVPFHGGTFPIGHGGGRFAYDNEGPRHDVLLRPFLLASRPVTNGEYLAFMRDGGYVRHELWLADGWARVHEEGWRAPAYWERREGVWTAFTLHGRRPVREEDPVCHVSYYEADAFARWAGARLPSEAEWEIASIGYDERAGRFVEDGVFHPRRVEDPPDERTLCAMFGDVWEWTASPYVPYPGYRPPAGAIGEYNGKFMVSQSVLRGGCCATPRSHVRRTYRNFFYPWMRWQFGGIRLARDAG